MPTWRPATFQLRRNSAYPGQIIILFAAAFVVLTAFVAVAVDVGYAINQRRGVQNAADASALAVAQTVMAGSTSQSVFNATATTYATQNGFPNATISVVVNTAANPETVTVNITSPVQEFFLGAVYHGSWAVGAHAVASLEPSPSSYALLALDKSGNPINLTGTVSINVSGGGAMSNAGMQCVGTGGIHADGTMDAAGGFSKTGGCTFTGTGGSNPAAAAVTDPLINVPPPPKPSVPSITGTSTCTNTPVGGVPAYNCTAGVLGSSGVSAVGTGGSITFAAGNHQLNGNVSVIGSNNTITFNPGTYYFNHSSLSMTGSGNTIVFKPGNYEFYMDTGSMTITGTTTQDQLNSTNVDFYFKNSNVSLTGTNSGNLPPGIYYFDGTGPTITGTSTVTGSNVLFYLDNNAQFTTTGTTGYNFTASPTSLYTGGQGGMLIYEARGSTGAVTLTGSSSSFLGGIVYLPSATLQLTGTSTGTWAQGQLIVDKLTNTGTTNATIKYKQYIDTSQPKIYLTQ
ncbi:MAG TPA: pilus assembly protein TadG-related protein [Nitrolancea sp.]|nr:pilus assembly protein TadG-related protein [Nitrolancea sp.]